ncbi:hypothetical protein JXM67_05625 [candidate division WOR-3 bacterium]|nr:hypothetical protein [candidate division WOR-3 bacterium]
MRRLSYSIGLVVLLASGCGRPEELSPEQYGLVLAEFRNEYYQARYWPKDMFVCDSYLDPVEWLWIKTNKGVETNPFSRLMYYKTMYLMFSRSCRRAGVSFREFNLAHARYGLLGLTCWEEVSQVARCAPDALYQGDYFLERNESNLEALETYLRLTQDLHTEIYWEPRIIIIGARAGGEIRIWDTYGRPMDGLVELEGLLDSTDSWDCIHVMPDPAIPLGELFNITSQIPSARRIVVSDSIYNFTKLFLTVYPLKWLHRLDANPELLKTDSLAHLVFVEMKSDGTNYLNSEEFTCIHDISQTFDDLLEKSSEPRVVISVDEEVGCGRLMAMVRSIRGRDEGRISITLIPSRVIKGHEPKLDNRHILEQDPRDFNEEEEYLPF